jgi:hypothetical protein
MLGMSFISTSLPYAQASSDPDTTSIPDPEIMSSLSGAVAYRIRHYSLSHSDLAETMHSDDSLDDTGATSPRTPNRNRRKSAQRPRPNSLHFDKDGNPTGQSRTDTKRTEPISALSDDERALLPTNHLADRLTRLAVSASDLTLATRHKLSTKGGSSATTTMSAATLAGIAQDNADRAEAQPTSMQRSESASTLVAVDIPDTPTAASCSPAQTTTTSSTMLEPPSSLSRSKSLPSKALASYRDKLASKSGGVSLTGSNLPMPPRGFRKHTPPIQVTDSVDAAKTATMADAASSASQPILATTHETQDKSTREPAVEQTRATAPLDPPLESTSPSLAPSLESKALPAESPAIGVMLEVRWNALHMSLCSNCLVGCSINCPSLRLEHCASHSLVTVRGLG